MGLDVATDLINTLQCLSLVSATSCVCTSFDQPAPPPNTLSDDCDCDCPEPPLTDSSPASRSNSAESSSTLDDNVSNPLDRNQNQEDMLCKDSLCSSPPSTYPRTAPATPTPTPTSTATATTTTTATATTASTPSTPMGRKSKPPITPPATISTYKVRLDITSDSTCPWCFITKRRIAKAIELFHALSPEARRVQFDIHWHPYQLDPMAPKEPIPKSKLYTRKFGPEKAIFVRERVMAAGKLEGIEFLNADDCLYCSTLNSHRLIRYARMKMGRTLFLNNINSANNMNTDKIDDNHDNDNSHGKNKNQNKNKKSTTNDYFFGGNDGNQQQDDDNNNNNSNNNNDDTHDSDATEMDCGIDKFGNRMEDAIVEELFQSHFERGECADIPTLKKCARSVLYQLAAIENARSPPPPSLPAAPGTPMPGANHSRLIDDEAIEQEMARIEQFLDSDEGLEEVVEEIRVAKHDMGIQGVPSIIVQNTYLLSGGQDSHTFVEIFKRVVV